ncbi:MAG: ribonuclease III [Lachnospiraceae bacterium]|nr:ribonuclease III [Lachnospiraceae bacterium]
MEEKDYAKIEDRLGYVFKDKSLLKTALTHSSYANECLLGDIECYERLEFLGDAVLELTVSEYLFRKMTDKREGELSKLRSQLVCEQSLSKLTRDMGLQDYLRLGKGEENSGGKNKNSILCDVFESVLGAIYIDGGFEKARGLVKREIFDRYENIIVRNYKSELQEMVDTMEGKPQIEYKTLEESGPDHDKVFRVGVYIGRELNGIGIGRSKKEAQQLAAAAALKK